MPKRKRSQSTSTNLVQKCTKTQKPKEPSGPVAASKKKPNGINEPKTTIISDVSETTLTLNPSIPSADQPGYIDSNIIQNNLAQGHTKTLTIQDRNCQVIIERRYNCRACIMKRNGDACRFKDFRAVDQLLNKGDTVPSPYFISTELGDMVRSRVQNNIVAPSEKFKAYALKKLSGPLYDILKKENEFIKKYNILIRRRAPVNYARHICDYCETSILNAHFTCGVCGSDMCLHCYGSDWSLDTIVRLTRCSRYRAHAKEHFLPVTKYEENTIRELAKEVQSVKDSQEDCIMQDNQDEVSYKEVLYIPIEESTIDAFQSEWRKGKPVVIRGVRTNSDVSWTPSYFIKNYKKEIIEVINCKTKEVDESTVKKYFSGFIKHSRRPGYNKSTGGSDILKIKDWPPTENFSDHSPKLYKDFMDMLPVKEYCTADGYFNFSNRLPEEYIPSDLGPKMFIAYGSANGEKGVGTTNLHCDMADAVNVMCYADKTDENSAAVWDIYAYEDLAEIKNFVDKIAKEMGVKGILDPVHSQWIYLNDSLQQRLLEEHNITSWRIYQNPGDAVYIPAGCAHQVSNYHSAIKCAFDFISPENIDRCIDVTNQFRHSKRVDALQLNNILLFAWRSIYDENNSQNTSLYTDK
ncbi:hypothetical protein J3Q64DRAFT_1767764 [Phycomyces blakesleeanus]|uniref:JmjC domain-containing protein n=1 Tax=Phycomyces blakesleeanus TaxID=4837 RepID=A0ABR3ALN5_PHYBL